MFIYIYDGESEYIINSYAISKVVRAVGGSSFYIDYKDGTRDNFCFADSIRCQECYVRVIEALIPAMKEDK